MAREPITNASGIFHARLRAEVEEMFDRKLRRHEVFQWVGLIVAIGRPQVQARLAGYDAALLAHIAKPMTMEQFLRRRGLWEARETGRTTALRGDRYGAA